MKRFNKLPLFSLLLIVAVSAASPNRSSPGKEEGKKVETKNVPLKLIYSTSGQKGLKRIDQGVGDKAFPNEMRELYQQATRMGASNVFLARGDDIAAAVTATWLVFTGGHPVDEPVKPDVRSKSDKIWLVAYLGVSGSEPPAWLVTSVEVSGQNIRLAFTKPGSETSDEHPYFVWVPLGKLEAGTYTLEMFDEKRKQAALSRRVTLSGK